MDEMLRQLKDFLRDAPFDWCVCGGHAIDLFLGHRTRAHEDVDVAAFWQEKRTIVGWMLNQGWRVFEALGGGTVCEMFDPLEAAADKRNLFCFSRDNNRCRLSMLGQDMYRLSMEGKGQGKLDYLEFLFNGRQDGLFLNDLCPGVQRTMERAVLGRDTVPYLAPELALLFKSAYVNRLNREDESSLRYVSNAVNDFNALLPRLDAERREWLTAALNAAYPSGHAWLRRLKSSQGNG